MTNKHLVIIDYIILLIAFVATGNQGYLIASYVFLSTYVILDEMENKKSNYLQSEEFKESFSKNVEEDTWEKGKPMYYRDDLGNIVEHWKDGTINIIKHAAKKNS